MTEQEFIERYVADNGGRIETGVFDHNLSRTEMVRCVREHAHEAWAELHNQLAAPVERETDIPPTAWIERCELHNDSVYVGIPEDKGESLRKVIFCPCGAFEGGVYVRFALYEESTGDHKLMVKDTAAHHAVSYHSVECVCMAKDLVGVNFEALPDMRFRLPCGEEMKLLDRMLVGANLSIEMNHRGMWHDEGDENNDNRRMIN